MYLEAVTLSQSATKKTIHNYCRYFESFISAIHLSSLQEKVCVEVTALRGLPLPLLIGFAVFHQTCMIFNSFFILQDDM